MQRLNVLGLLGLLLLILPTAAFAQEDLTEEYTFLDETTFNYPSDFNIYNEESDGVFMANEFTDIYFFTLYERTQTDREIQNLGQALDLFLGDAAEFEPKDGEVLFMEGREIFTFSYIAESDSGFQFERDLYALYVGENGTILLVSVIPGEGLSETTQEDLVLDILRTVRVAGTSLDTGNVLQLDNDVLLDYPESWQPTEDADNALTNGSTRLTVQVFTSQQLQAEGFKNDPIDVLFSLYARSGTEVAFDASRIQFDTLGEREIVTYRFSDEVEGRAVERLYITFFLQDNLLVFADIVTDDAAFADEEAVLGILGTLRPAGEVTPTTQEMTQSFILYGGATISFPDDWRAEERDETAVTLNSLETSVFILAFTPDEAQAQNLDGDLANALLEVVAPLDETVVLKYEDIVPVEIRDDIEAVMATYTETTEDGDSYQRNVYMLRLSDGTTLFVGVVPQPGVDMLADEAIDEVLDILATLTLP